MTVVVTRRRGSIFLWMGVFFPKFTKLLFFVSSQNNAIRIVDGKPQPDCQPDRPRYQAGLFNPAHCPLLFYSIFQVQLQLTGK